MRTENVAVAALPNWVGIQVARARPALLKACHAAAMRGITIVQQTIAQTKPFAPVDRGSYRASFRAERQPDGALLFSDAPHAAFIEYGTRPHWAPIGPLAEWVRRKRIARGAEVMAVARAIQLKIARRGTAPKKVVERSLREVEKALDEEVARALVEGVEGGR